MRLSSVLSREEHAADRTSAGRPSRHPLGGRWIGQACTRNRTARMYRQTGPSCNSGLQHHVHTGAQVSPRRRRTTGTVREPHAMTSDGPPLLLRQVGGKNQDVGGPLTSGASSDTPCNSRRAQSSEYGFVMSDRSWVDERRHMRLRCTGGDGSVSYPREAHRRSTNKEETA